MLRHWLAGTSNGRGDDDISNDTPQQPHPELDELGPGYLESERNQERIFGILENCASDGVEEFKKTHHHYFYLYERHTLKRAPLVTVLIDFNLENLYEYDESFFDLLTNSPLAAVGILENAIIEYLVPDYEQVEEVHKKVRAQIALSHPPSELVTKVQSIRVQHVGRLVALQNVTMSRFVKVRTQILVAMFQCKKCGFVNDVSQTTFSLTEPLECMGCNKPVTRTKFELLEEESLLRDVQKVEFIQGFDPPAAVEAYLYGAQCGYIHAGENIEVIGVIRTREKRIKKGLSTQRENFLHVLGIRKAADTTILVTEEDKVRFLRIATEKGAGTIDYIRQSFAPHVFDSESEGIRSIKIGLLAAIVGSKAKYNDDGSVSVVGDIHVAMIGDTGTCKSVLLEYITKLVPGAIYVDMTCATKASLTVAAVRDEFGEGRWTLDVGDCVLASGHPLLIDEIDKCDSNAISALNQPMQFGFLQVDKAGIRANFRTESPVIAASNPIYGRFDRGEPPSEQIPMRPETKSRFDILFLLFDDPTVSQDKSLAEHIILGEECHHNPEGVLSFVDLQKWIKLAKSFHPEFTEEAEKRMIEFYVHMRSIGDAHGIAISPRQIQSIKKIAYALARLRLSSEVGISDVTHATRLIGEFLVRASGGSLNMGDILSKRWRDRRSKHVDEITWGGE